MDVQGQPPVPELGLEYADDQDGLVEYMNDSYDQDLLDEEGFEGEGYPEELEGRSATSAMMLRLLETQSSQKAEGTSVETRIPRRQAGCFQEGSTGPQNDICLIACTEL